MNETLIVQIQKQINDYQVEFKRYPEYIIFDITAYQLLLNIMLRDCGYNITISSNKKKIKRLMGIKVLKCLTVIPDGFILAEGVKNG